GAKERLRMFLEQYWGGPKAYGERRGHPRLRMRHAPFPVSPAAKDAWLRHMNAALDEGALAPMHDAAMRDYFERAAHSVISTDDGGEAPRPGGVVPVRLQCPGGLRAPGALSRGRSAPEPDGRSAVRGPPPPAAPVCRCRRRPSPARCGPAHRGACPRDRPWSAPGS